VSDALADALAEDRHRRREEMRGLSAAAVSGVSQEWLFRFVFCEKSPGFFEVEGDAVYGQLIDTGVFRDGDDMFHTMATVSEGLDEKLDIYHAQESTGFRFSQDGKDLF
jgi:hypothetical protein